MEATVIATIAGGLIGAGSSIITQYMNLRREDRLLRRKLLLKEYNNLSKAMKKYNAFCIDLTKRSLNKDEAYELFYESQHAFFELQYVFRRPLLIEDKTLQKKLEEWTYTSCKMTSEIQKAMNSDHPIRIDNAFMSEQTEIINELNVYLGKRMEENAA